MFALFIKVHYNHATLHLSICWDSRCCLLRNHLTVATPFVSLLRHNIIYRFVHIFNIISRRKNRNLCMFLKFFSIKACQRIGLIRNPQSLIRILRIIFNPRSARDNPFRSAIRTDRSAPIRNPRGLNFINKY